MGKHHIETHRVGRVHIGRWSAAVVLAAGIGFLLLGGVAGSDSSVTVTQGDFELTCPVGTISEGATLTCTLTNTAAEAKPWPVVAILHLSTDTDRALVRGSSIDVTLGAPSPGTEIEGGVTWIGDTLVGWSRFDWPGNAGADPTETTTTVGAPGNSRTVNIVAAQDSLDENSEKFYVALGPDASRGVGILYNNKGELTLTDDDGPSTDTSLSSLGLLAGSSYTLSPTQATQSQTVAYQVTEATLTATAASGSTMAMSASFGDNSLDLDGRGGASIDVISGQEGAAVPLAVGTTAVTLTVTAEDGTTTGTHTVRIVRSALGDNVDTVAVSVPNFTLTCPAEVTKGIDAECTLRASDSAEWPVVAVIHSSADGASRALVAEDPIIPDTDPDYSQDVSLGEQQPMRTAFNRGYGELLSGGSHTLYRTYGYEKFDWSGTASAGATRTITLRIHDNDVTNGGTAEVFYVGLAPSGYTGLSQLVDNKVPILLFPDAPSVTGVEVTSDAGDDDAYAMGEVISVRVSFSAAVNVTGTPTLGIDMDPADGGRENAVYSAGSGTTELTFTHEVIRPNYSSQGIAVLADTLALNGGTIQSVAKGVDADLAHSGLGHDPDHKVDWQLNRPPVLTTRGCDLVIAEDVPHYGNICTIDAFDTEAVPLTWSLSGADASGFTLIEMTAPQAGGQEQSRALFFKPRFNVDFEAPDDADGDNEFEVTVTASDGVESASVDVSVSVTDVDEPFLLTCAPAQPFDAANQRWTLVEPPLGSTGEAYVPGSLVAGHCSVADPEGAAVAYSLSGTDAAMFDIGIEGTLSFATAPDFEAPADSDNDNVYEVTVTAGVGAHTLFVNVAVGVTDAEEAQVTTIVLPAPTVPDCALDPDGPLGSVCGAVSGSELMLTFNSDLGAVSSADASALRYAIYIDGASDRNGDPIANQSPSSVAVDGNTLTLTLGTAIAPGADITVTYYSGLEGALEDASGTEIAAFTTDLVAVPREWCLPPLACPRD